MMTLQDRPTFTMPVTVNTVAVKGSFTITFLALPISEIKKLEEAARAENGGDAGFVRRVAVDVCDVDFPLIRIPGPSVPEPSEKVNALLDWPGVAAAAGKAFYVGMYEEQQKNSPPPPSGS